MRTIIRFAGLQLPEPPLQAQLSLALQSVGGSTVLGHLLKELEDVLDREIFLLTNEDIERLEAWLETWAPNLAVQVIADSAPTLREGLLALQPILDEQPTLLVHGGLITQADYTDLHTAVTDVVSIAGRDLDPGACWVRQGTDLLAVTEELADVAGLADVAAALASRGRAASTLEATFSLDVTTLPGLLAANARLLTLGRGSEDAIERSYVEDFTVIPPVFLHETAVVENVVIGPYVHIEAGAVVRDSVLRHAIVCAGGQVRQAVLEGAVVGEGAKIHGRALALAVPARAALHIDAAAVWEAGRADA